MESAKKTLVTAIKTVAQRQQLLMANLTGNAFLGFLLYAWRTMNGGLFGNLSDTVFVLFFVGGLAVWLNAATLAAFHPGVTTTPFMPVLRRLPRVLPWVLAIIGVALLFRWIATVVHPLAWVVGVGCLLVLLPLTSQAAGGGFPRSAAIDVVFNGRYWLLSAGLLALGIYLPLLLISELGVPGNLLFRLFLGCVRMAVFSFCAVGGWVTLAAITGLLGAEAAEQQELKAISTDAMIPGKHEPAGAGR